MATEKNENFWIDISSVLVDSITNDIEQYENEKENWNSIVCREIANGIAVKVNTLLQVMKDDK